MELDIIEEEEEDDCPIPEDDSGAYHGSSGGRATTSYPATRCREDENTESDLIVRPFLDRFIAWVTYLLLGYFVFPEFA